MSSARDQRARTVATVDARRSALATVVAAWGPVAVWVALIFSLSSDRFSDANTATWLAAVPLVGRFGIPPAVIEAANVIVRKSAHFVEYAVLSMLSFRALRATWGQRRGRELLAWAVTLAAVCASVDELHQHFWTRHRTGTTKDIVLDAVGATAGAIAGATYLYRRVGRRAA